MKESYSEKTRITEEQVGDFGFIRIAKLFELIQDVSDEHQDELGVGWDTMTEQGLLWIVADHHAEINRMPRLDEEITVSTWLGKTRHMFYPRYYKVDDAEGNTLLKVGSMWTFLKADSRTLITVGEKPFDNEGIVTGDETAMLKGPKVLPRQAVAELSVPAEWCDRNGHMNNAWYFEACERALAPALAGEEPSYISAQYTLEAYEGERLCVSLGNNENQYYASCDSERGNHFKLEIKY